MGRENHDREDRNPLTSARGISLGCARDSVTEPYCCALHPLARECFHLSRRQCKSLSCTCYTRSPASPQNHDSPMASEVPRPVSYWPFVGDSQETCPETPSQATGHQRARWCTPGGMAPDSQSNHWAAHQKHEAYLSCVPGADWSPNLLLRLL